ncbi:hypothetical protein, partial [Streptacidiphilus sp. EB103A]|uniref:hypothetical protein n=1 Tax=Streptacidiphilus sp. EB103A TaxID=3156275 RepID=UPI003512EB3E
PSADCPDPATTTPTQPENCTSSSYSTVHHHALNRQLITTKHVLIFCCLILPFTFGAVLILMELISPGSTSVQGGVGGGGN